MNGIRNWEILLILKVPPTNMIKIIQQALILLFLSSIIVYIGQGILYESTWYTKLSGIYLLLFNFYCTFCVIIRKHCSPLFAVSISFAVWTILLWLISVKGYTVLGEKVSTLSMVQHIVLVVTSLPSFYFIALGGHFRKPILILFTLVIAVLYVYNILHFDVTTLGAGEYNYASANNKAYSLVALFPFLLLFWNKKWLMILLMLASLVFIVFCLKRGAMLCIAAYMLITFYMIIRLNKRRNKYKYVTRFVVVFIIVAFVYAFFDIYNDNEFLQKRFDHGSEARESIYTKILSGLENSDIIEFFIGHGPLSTVTVAGNYAHNDWLEIVYDFGIVGLILYIIIPIAMLKYYKRYSLEEELAGILICVLYIVLRSSFSMCVYELDSLLTFGFMGYIIGNHQYQSKNAHLLMRKVQKNN